MIQGFASGALGSLGSSAFGAVAGAEIAGSTLGTVAFGAVSGGVGAALTGGDFWQGAGIGASIALLNHAAHRVLNGPGDGDPQEKKRTERKSKKSRIQTAAKYAHTVFDAMEEIGGWTEAVGIIAAPFTEGTSLGISILGAEQSAIGTFGNVITDLTQLYDTGNSYYLKSAIYRSVKFGVTFGLGRAIDRVPGLAHSLDKTILKITNTVYEKTVTYFTDKKIIQKR